MKVHFIGIGGIGVSAIARMLLAEGAEVSGSDQAAGQVTAELEKLGAKISIGHRAENVPVGVGLVVYTIAITQDNPEWLRARELGVELVSYPEYLGRISASKFTIAVAGTHGKTTTTAMVTEILVAAGLDPTVIVGSFLKGQKSNFIAGKSDLLVVEACEYRRSFLNLSPRILIITNIDNDHLDYYTDLADIQRAFIELVEKLPPDGLLITRPKDPVLAPVVAASRARVLDYERLAEEFSLKVPGAHNRANAKAALAVAAELHVPYERAMAALENFAGTWRRFEYRGELPNGAKVYDDYGHHPTEIKATLEAARSLKPKRLIVVFQPHLYSRTKKLFADFVTSLGLADLVYLAPIYAAREPVDPSVTSDQLAEALVADGRSAKVYDRLEAIAETLKAESVSGDVIVTMGAGDVVKVADLLV